MINITCFWSFGAILGLFGPFFIFSHKTWFFAYKTQRASWQKWFGAKTKVLCEMTKKSPNGPKMAQNGPKWSKTCYIDHLGSFWAHLDSFWSFHTKLEFLLQITLAKKHFVLSRQPLILLSYGSLVLLSPSSQPLASLQPHPEPSEPTMMSWRIYKPNLWWSLFFWASRASSSRSRFSALFSRLFIFFHQRFLVLVFAKVWWKSYFRLMKSDLI